MKILIKLLAFVACHFAKVVQRVKCSSVWRTVTSFLSEVGDRTLFDIGFRSAVALTVLFCATWAVVLDADPADIGDEVGAGYTLVDKTANGVVLEQDGSLFTFEYSSLPRLEEKYIIVAEKDSNNGGLYVSASYVAMGVKNLLFALILISWLFAPFCWMMTVEVQHMIRLYTESKWIYRGRSIGMLLMQSALAVLVWIFVGPFAAVVYCGVMSLFDQTAIWIEDKIGAHKVYSKIDEGIIFVLSTWIVIIDQIIILFGSIIGFIKRLTFDPIAKQYGVYRGYFAAKYQDYCSQGACSCEVEDIRNW